MNSSNICAGTYAAAIWACTSAKDHMHARRRLDTRNQRRLFREYGQTTTGDDHRRKLRYMSSLPVDP